jgi:hypothetical protein
MPTSATSRSGPVGGERNYEANCCPKLQVSAVPVRLCLENQCVRRGDQAVLPPLPCPDLPRYCGPFLRVAGGTGFVRLQRIVPQSSEEMPFLLLLKAGLERGSGCDGGDAAWVCRGLVGGVVFSELPR